MRHLLPRIHCRRDAHTCSATPICFPDTATLSASPQSVSGLDRTLTALPREERTWSIDATAFGSSLAEYKGSPLAVTAASRAPKASEASRTEQSRSAVRSFVWSLQAGMPPSSTATLRCPNALRGAGRGARQCLCASPCEGTYQRGSCRLLGSWPALLSQNLG